jgi:5-methylthioadenosine/S-adenosylhomocysteine deaminase
VEERGVEWFTADRVFIEGAYRPPRWIGVEGGAIRTVSEQRPEAGSIVEFPESAIFPGTVNTHTHAFHSLMRGCGDDLPLLEWLHDVVYRHAAQFTAEQAYLGAALAFAEMLKNGITTVVDFFYLNGLGNEYALATIRAAEDVGVRLVLARTFMDWEHAPSTIRETVPQSVARYGELVQAYRAHPTVKVCPAAHSLYAASPEMIQAAVDASRTQGTRWHMHVADAAGAERSIRERFGRSTVSRMAELGLLTDSLVAVHAVYADETEVKLLGERRVKVSHNPSANMFLGDKAARILAMRRVGICVGLGTDGGLDNNSLSIFHEMKMAALVQKSMAGDPQAIAAKDVLEMGTVNGGLITEWPVGRLKPGCLADFLVIDLSDLALVPGDRLESHMVYSMSDRAIRHVYVHGRCVVRDGRLTGIDERDLARRVYVSTRAIFQT